MATMTIKLRLAWWSKPCAYALVIFAYLCDREPNWDRVNRLIARAVRIA